VIDTEFSPPGLDASNVARSVTNHTYCELGFTRYCHHQYCMVYGIHKRGRWGGRILRNGREIVLQ